MQQYVGYKLYELIIFLVQDFQNPFRVHCQDLTHVLRCYLGGWKTLGTMTIDCNFIKNFSATDNVLAYRARPIFHICVCD